MTSTCPFALDDKLGPAVDGCRRSFDFTLLFEQSILSILPSATCILLSIGRIWQIRGRPSSVRGAKLLYAKLITTFALIAIRLALVVLWSKNSAFRTRCSIPSTVLALIAALVLIPLTWLEHHNSIRPSPVISTCLAFITLFDLAQLRTLWLLEVSISITAVNTTNFTVQGFLLLLESASKDRSLIHTSDAERSPEDRSGIASRSLFFWMNKLIFLGYRRALVLKDLYPTASSSRADVLETRLTASWSKSSSGTKHRLLRVTCSAYYRLLFAAVIPRICMVGFTVCQPLLLLRLINFLNDRPSSPNVGYGLVGAYALVYLGIAISTAWYWYEHSKFIAAVRGGVVALIYDRTLTLSISAIDKASSVTVMSADVERIVFGLRTIHDIWANFIQVAIAAWLLERQTGVAVVAPLVIAVACAYGTIQIGTRAGGQQMEWLKRIEKRIGVTSSTLSAMRGAKMSGLTEKLLDMIQSLRASELQAAGRFRWWLIGALMMGYVPVMISPVLTFATVIAISKSQDKTLDTATMFTSLSFLILISQPLAMLFQSVPSIMSMVGCFDRIEKFIQTAQRIDPRHLQDRSESEKEHEQTSYMIKLIDSAFGWDKDQASILKNVNLEIPRGKLTFVIGPVGCGKSTLLKAMLGETVSLGGSIHNTPDSVAFCDQTPWIINGTFKKNVSMFEDVRDPFYNTVVRACGLEDDLRQLPEGDASNLGSKGITLSGGQKQRLSLARLAFARCRFNICDDILSGLDSTTEKHVFTHVFGSSGLLRKQGATTVIATHAVHLLPYADYIVCVDSDGTICQQGTFAELKAQDGYVNRLNISDVPSILEVAEEEAVTQSKPSSKTDELNAKCAMAASQALTIAEPEEEPSEIEKDVEILEHSKHKGVYRFYVTAVGPLMCAFYLLLGLAYAFLYNFPFIWAKWWSDENQDRLGDHQSYYMGIYAMLQVLCLVSLGLVAWHGVITIVTFGGRALHWKLLSTALSAPLSFFEKTDTGVTLNRFGQDMQLIDSELPMALFNVVCGSLTLLGQLLLIITASYWLALAFPAIFLFIWMLQRIYLRTSRRLRHLELETKAPLYSQFIETLDGVATLRAFAWESKFRQLNYDRLDASQRPFYLLMCLQRWLGLVLDCFSAGLVLLIVGIIVGLRDRISPGFAGVALSNMINLSSLMSILVMVWTQLETSIASVERIKDFERDTPSETRGLAVQNPPESWPDKGRIEIRKLTATYRDGATKALNNLIMDIKPGEKIGVCGRTGSGKTSLMLSLFRMITICSGSILIDGFDIATMPPSKLRGALNAIPQEPYFLSGTVRANADPAGVNTDEKIWRAISAVHLKSVIDAKGGLDTQMVDDTLSHGEKQLFCLARAILKGCRVVVLDEATSNIDVETEKLIRKTIDEEFKNCTVIMIAHRLDSILTCDRIAVLDTGKLVEFDNPDVLLGSASRFKEFYDTYSRG